MTFILAFGCIVTFTYCRPITEVNRSKPIITPGLSFKSAIFVSLLELTLREEHRLRVFEKRVIRRIFGPKRDEVTESWRKLHNEELHGLYSSPSIVRVIKAKRMRWAGHVARMGEVRGAYNIWLGGLKGGDH
jgi:hypothetical protein